MFGAPTAEDAMSSKIQSTQGERSEKNIGSPMPNNLQVDTLANATVTDLNAAAFLQSISKHGQINDTEGSAAKHLDHFQTFSAGVSNEHLRTQQDPRVTVKMQGVGAGMMSADAGNLVRD